MKSKAVLVTGATGYVGGRLIPRLLEKGYHVRAMARSTAKLESLPWADHPQFEITAGDMQDRDSLIRAAQGCDTAYYLVHSMRSGSEYFDELDRKAAYNMVAAASQVKLSRIIYLGGLGIESQQPLSKHLRSRLEVARILQSGSVPVTCLRAAMILGSGSASFELLRYIAEKFPVIITPTWVNTLVQPIAIRNVLNYLIGCLEHEETTGETFDIGGPDVLTYKKLFDIYAKEAHLPKRIIIPVPVLSLRLSSYWVHFFTPVHFSIARALVEGLQNTVICRDNRLRSIIPQELLTPKQAIRLALERVQQARVETCWTDAGYICPAEWIQFGDASYSGGTILDCSYRIYIKSTPKEIWQLISKLGGETGYFYADRLWGLRGWLDTVVGGVGLRRGRRHPTIIRMGDALDFWRVLETDPPRRLLLLAEMKLPGEAVLEFRIIQHAEDRCELQQISRFMPHGLFGILYWYCLYPFHHYIYKGMLKRISKILNKTIIQGPEPFKAGSISRGVTVACISKDSSIVGK
jgi:uncharacterized protein YbjT (DUF2867 family)